MSIRDDFFANKAVGALWDVAVSIKRGNPLPLDSNSVFDSYSALETYAAGVLAYPGQIVAVVNADSTGIYYLDQNLAINEVGKIPTADNKSIEVADGIISMYNFGKYYYKYIPEVKNEETGEVTSTARYEKTEVSDTNVWAAGLEPKVVSENGEFVIGWFEPNPTTINDVQDQVTAVQGAVTNLDNQLNQAGGLVDKVEEIQQEIGHAATDASDTATGLYAELEKKANKTEVYTKEEVNGLLNDKANAADVYTKTETDSEIAKAVSAADHLKRKIVADYSAIETYINGHDDAEQYIFMVPTVYQYTQESNKYDEYIVLSSGEGGSKVYTIEPIGTWAVDLEDYVSETELANYLKSYYTSAKVDEILAAYATTAALETELKKYYTIEQLSTILNGYYTESEIDALLGNIYSKTEVDNKFNDYYNKTETNNLLNNKVEVVEGKSLVLDTEIAKLATVEENAEENYIKSVTERFSVSEAGQLSLNPLGVGDITGLENALNNKVDKVIYNVPVVDGNGDPVYEEDGITQKTEQVEGTLLSPEDRKKLAALVIGDEGVQISGKVNADNVEGLATWITRNRGTVPGLLSAEQQTHLEAVEKNYINSVDTNVFEVTADRQLLLKEVPSNVVAGLPELTTKVGNLDAILNGYTDEGNNKVQGLVEIVNNFDNTYVSISDFNSAVGDLSALLESSTTLVGRIDELDQRLKWQDMTE